MNLENVPILITQTGLQRRVGIAPATFSQRLRERSVKPSAILHSPKGDALLFDMSKLAEFRAQLLNDPIQTT